MRPSTSLSLIALIGFVLCFLSSFTFAADHNLQIVYDEPIRKLMFPDSYWGVNYAAYWDNDINSTGSMYALNKAGIQTLRFPGGVPAVYYDWTKPLLDGWTKIDTDDLWKYAQGVGSNTKLVLQTNPTTLHSSNNSVSHQAAWVEYCKNKGIKVPFWEIGNEHDNYDSAPWYGSGQFPAWYMNSFNQVYPAIKQKDPNALVFGPVGTNWGIWWGGNPSLIPFLKAVGDKQGSGNIDGVSLHFYPGPSSCPGWTNIKSAPQDWISAANWLDKTLPTYHSKKLPVIISETNAAVSAQGCDVGQTIASAIVNADLFGVFRDTNVEAVQFFGAIHVPNGNWGILYGSGVNGFSLDSATPTYFAFPMWTRAGDTILNVTGVTDAKTTVSAHASKRADGTPQIMIINKSNAAVSVSVTVNTGFTLSGTSPYVFELRPKTPGSVWEYVGYYNDVLTTEIDVASPSATLPPPKQVAVTGSSFDYNMAAYSMIFVDWGTPAPPSGGTTGGGSDGTNTNNGSPAGISTSFVHDLMKKMKEEL